MIILSFLIRQINKSACIGMHVIADKNTNCAYKMAWFILFMLQNTGMYFTICLCIYTISQPNGSMFATLSNSMGVIVLNELPNFASSVYLMYLEGNYNYLVNREDFLIMDVDTNILVSTLVWAVIYLINNNLILFNVVIFEPFTKLISSVDVVGDFVKKSSLYLLVISYLGVVLVYLMPLRL